MLTVTEVAGFVGAGLAGAAYVPQIWHLVSQHCSAGLSRVAFSVWLIASLLVTSHAIAIHATVFIVLGAIQLTATALILVFTIRYANSYCATHLPVSVALSSTDADTATQTALAVLSASGDVIPTRSENLP